MILQLVKQGQTLTWEVKVSQFEGEKGNKNFHLFFLNLCEKNLFHSPTGRTLKMRDPLWPVIVYQSSCNKKKKGNYKERTTWFAAFKK